MTKNEKWIVQYGESGEVVIWNEGYLWLTNKALYLEGINLKRIALGNIKEVKHSNTEGSFSLDIIPIVDKKNQIRSLQGLQDAVKTRRLINEAIAEIPKEDQLAVSQEVVLNNINLTIPRSEQTNDKYLKSKLNHAIGEKDVDWLWIHEVKSHKPYELPIFMGGLLIFIGAILLTLYTQNYSTAVMLIGGIMIYFFQIMLPMFDVAKYTIFGITHNRIVALSPDAKKVEQLAISSIQSNKIERKEGVSSLEIATARKKIKISELKFDKEVHKMIEDLKENSEDLLFLD